MKKTDAVKKILESSNEIRDWYANGESDFTLETLDTIYECDANTYGGEHYGDLLDMIISDGIDDKIITEDWEDAE